LFWLVFRRYLWIDAFGVLNFVSLAHQHPEMKAEMLACAKCLIESVERTLGKPRTQLLPMKIKENGSYVGLRIGKSRAKVKSDAGMNLDGMYW
jgi:hypothetical protein